MKKLTKKQIELFQNKKLNESYWLSELGYANSKANNISTEDSDFIYDFYKQGEKLWSNYKEQLKSLLCDLENGIPKPQVKNIASGDTRLLFDTVFTTIIENINTEASIAYPIFCIAMNNGLDKFCSFNE